MTRTLPDGRPGSISRLLLFAVFIAAGHVALTVFLFPLSREEMAGGSHRQQLEALDASASASEQALVFLGDSVNFSVAASDRDKRRVSEVLQELLPQRPVVTIDHKAYHAGVFRGFVSRIAGREPKPGIVVVPVNLRSFTTHWTMNPSWQFVDLQRYLRDDGLVSRLLFRPLRSLKIHGDSTLSAADFAKKPVYDGDAPVGRVLDFQRIAREPVTPANTRAMITYYYLERVRADNQRLRDLLAIAEIARTERLNVLFYVTPLDYQACDQATSGQFSLRVKESVGAITAALGREGAEVLDLSFALGRDGFSYRSAYIDEHLNEAGRRFVAEQLAGRIGRGRLAQS